jgi:asparaginyl-tRNA synthetase
VTRKNIRYSPKSTRSSFLREIAHLRSRTNTFGAVMRVRHAMAYASSQIL